MNAKVFPLHQSGVFIGLLLLVPLLLSCGEGPSASEEKEEVPQEPASSRLSFGDYLAVCSIPTSGVNEGEYTLEDFSAALGEYSERLESVEPPEEVAQWHTAVLAYQKALKMKLDEGPQEGQSEDEHLLATALTIALNHQAGLNEAIMGMDAEVLARMVEAGCIYEDYLGSTEGEGNEIPRGDVGQDGGGPITEFSSVSAGKEHTCGVGTDGSVACWGEDWSGETQPPEGEFSSVSVGQDHTCGVRIDGSVACWGDNEEGQATPPEGEFSSVSAGEYHTCGVRTDGSVVCWGANGRGQATPPEGEFSVVSAGRNHTCGVKTDGSVVCWGDDFLDKATAPEGEFISVAAAFAHSCGVRADGSIACWGQDLRGEAAPPEGQFVSVTGGQHHSCGLGTNGSVVCWGDDEEGQSSPPEGEFVSVSAGSYHTCGVSTDASVACWGADNYGQASPPSDP